jgi:opacity protein-like surface antigen
MDIRTSVRDEYSFAPMALGIAAYLCVLPEIAFASPMEKDTGWYASIFGGTGVSGRQHVRQNGAAYMRGAQALPGYKDFDLVVDVRGRASTEQASIAGVHFGHRFEPSDGRVRYAIEGDLLGIAQSERATLQNRFTSGVANVGTPGGDPSAAAPGPVIDAKYGPGQHRFRNTMHLRSRLAMFNAVAAYTGFNGVEPYAAVGVGLAWVKASQAVSHQTSPSGPIEVSPITGEHVNHFNGKDHASDRVLAWQARAGARGHLTSYLSWFAEYRYIGVAPVHLAFGPTRYPGHATTDPWQVRRGAAHLHAGIVGMQYSL